jgi:hypothetical protein
MADMGRYFRPPARRDLRAWRELERLAAHGFRFRREGHVAWRQFVQNGTTGRLDAAIMIANCSCQHHPAGKWLLRQIALRQYAAGQNRQTL